MVERDDDDDGPLLTVINLTAAPFFQRNKTRIRDGKTSIEHKDPFMLYRRQQRRRQGVITVQWLLDSLCFVIHVTNQLPPTRPSGISLFPRIFCLSVPTQQSALFFTLDIKEVYYRAAFISVYLNYLYKIK